MRLLARVAAITFALTVAAFAQTASPLPAGKRPITEKDLFAFTWIGDPQLSPDGHTVAFVQTTVTPDHSGYQTSLYTLDTAAAGAAAQRLTDGPRDQSPRWSPDGKQIAFVRAVERDGRLSPPQVYLLPLMPGASAIRITDLPKGAGSPQWSPDGAHLLVTSSTPQDPAEVKRLAARTARATGDAAHVSDVRVITHETYRFNGEGYLDPSFVPQIYLITPPTGDAQPGPVQLTDGKLGVREAVWDGPGAVLYTRPQEGEPKPGFFATDRLFVVPTPAEIPAAGAIPPSTLVKELPLEASGLALSPDSKQLAFHAEAYPQPPARPVSHQESDLFVLDLAGSGLATTAPGAPRNLTGGKGFEMGSGVGGDNTAPRGGGRPAIRWAQNNRLLDVAGSQGSALLLAVDAQSGDITRLSARRQAVLSFAALPSGKSIVALISNPILIGDLFRIDPAAEPGGPHAGSGPPLPGNQMQLTHVNDALFSQLDVAMPQDLHVKPTVRAGDIPFLTIDTFVELPPDFPMQGDQPGRPTKPYPAILNIHGGPHSAYGWVFDHEMLWMAAKGYVVVYPNPRGSTTYGQNFANVIESNYPGDDFHDLMDTVDAVIAKGWADPGRLGVTGGSGGGLLTDWTVTQTSRFKAAVAQRDIVDQAAWWYTADFGEFHQYWMPEAPFDHVDLYRAHSPLTFVNNVKTPMMFILGEADYRTPPTSGGEEFFRYLKYRGIPTVMVRFPRETHELSRSGEPWHRIERLENIVNWFDYWLDGVCQPQYDDLPPCTASRP